jgi:hypothetical protein
VYCYFKHEDEAKGPDFALQLREIRAGGLTQRDTIGSPMG